MGIRGSILIFLVISISYSLSVAPAYSQAVPGTDFPYGRFELKTPPQESPIPGLGNYYSALSRGIDTVLWNPASLTALEHAQTSVSMISELKNYEYTRGFETQDSRSSIGDQSFFNIGYYFTGDQSVTTAATREHTAHALYRTASTGIRLKQAFRLNDMWSFGIMTQSSTGFSMDLSGNFPTIVKSEADFLNATNFLGSGMSIDSGGYLTYTYSGEAGATYIYKTTQPLWSGFLSQSSTIPLDIIMESRNDISLEPGMTMCGALKWKDLSAGLSFTPISATANVNNYLRGIIRDGTPDGYIYQPNIDFDNEKDALNWLQDPGRYGNDTGYNQNTITVPAGEPIAEAAYKGFYQASALRTDLGFSYDLGDVLTLALAFENFSGASLNFRGEGRVAYAHHRISTAEPTGFDNPSQEFTWDLFKDEFEPAEGTENWSLQEQISVDLPKKMRLGLALKKPFLIAIDYEQNQTPIIYTTIENNQEKVITISNIQVLRLGGETQLLIFPVWLRGGVPLLLKPNIEGLDQQSQDQLNNIFRFGVVPAGLDLGADINFWGTLVGASFGFNVSTITALYQLDSLNSDLGKLGYYDLYTRNGPWQVKYLAVLDPASTASAYGTRADKSSNEFKMEYLKWIQTFTVSYTF